MKIGNVVSVLAEKQKPIVYITDGQIVPQDIQRATSTRLLMSLDGFTIRREELEKRFGVTRTKRKVFAAGEEENGITPFEQRRLTEGDIS